MPSYEDIVFSVFSDKDAENPIHDHLRQERRDLTVGDIGCGPGNFLPFLSSQFKRVVAVDYCDVFLAQAKRRHSNLKNVEYIELDMTDLSQIHNSLDIAISVNSLIPQSIIKLEKMISEIYQTIKPEGKFVGIMPSVEGMVIYPAQLKFLELIQTGINEQQAIGEVEQEYSSPETKQNVTALGFYQEKPEHPRQKYHFGPMIKWRFNQAGFKSVELDKVRYSWEFCKKMKYPGYFPGHDRPWDWFVTARKPKKEELTQANQSTQ